MISAIVSYPLSAIQQVRFSGSQGWRYSISPSGWCRFERGVEIAESTYGRRAKFLLAVLGGSAAMVMAGFAVVIGESGEPVSVPAASPVLPGPMTQGDTVTTTIAPSALATEKAVVTHKAQPYKG